MKKNSFVLYADYLKYFNELCNEEKGKLIDALLKYCQDMPIENEMNAMQCNTKMAFLFISNQTDIDAEKYDRRCETSKINGQLGGNPAFKKGQPNPYYNSNNDNLKDNLNDNLKDNPITPDNPNDNDNVNDNDNKKNKKKSTVLTDSEIDILIDKSFKDIDVANKFREFIAMRKAKGQSKAVRTKATFDGLVKKIRDLAVTKTDAIEILQNAIDNCWQGLFPISNEKMNSKSSTVEVPPYAN